MADSDHEKLPAYSECEVLASLCRESFADFVKEMWSQIVPDRLVWNWHMAYLCDQLQEMAERVIAGKKKKHDLIINISPGTSKSLLTSVFLPVWCWTRMPAMKAITASYAYSLATDLSRKSRDLIKSDLFLACYPDIVIRDDQDAKGHYLNTAGGERYAIGTGGSVIGKHAHMIIVDDPLDPNAATSDAELEKANRWLEETIPTRKTDKDVTPIILIMQRLHEFDPTGSRLAKANKIPVFHVCLPAELTEDVSPKECREFYVDGLMDPIRLGENALAEAEAQGEYPYAAQFLQKPVPRGGAMFHPDKIEVGLPTHIVRKVRYWDKAGTCLVAGTAVAMRDSIKPIEQVKVGEMVWTRAGLRRVVWSGAKRVVEELTTVRFSDGTQLVGTPDHRIWLVGKGWTELAKISSPRYDPDARSGEPQWHAGQPPMPSNTTASATHERSDTTKRGDGTKSRKNTSLIPCTAPSIGTTTGPSRPDTTCITRITTQTTTTPTILLSLPNPTTADCTMLSAAGTLPKKPKRRGKAICAKDSPPSLLSRSKSTLASNAEASSNPGTPIQQGSNIAEAYAAAVPMSGHEKPVALRKNEVGVVHVVGVESVSTSAVPPTLVYDLEVERDHEFYANGVLVHNSGGGAFTVGALMGLDKDGRFWILDIVRGQWDSGRRERIIREVAGKDGKGIVIYIEQEPGSGGKQSAEGSIRGLAGYRVRSDKVGKSDGDKEARADAFSSQVNIGNVSMALAFWNDDLIKELRFFPRSRYKDQVDACSGAFNCLAVPKVTLGGRRAIEAQMLS